MLSFFKKKMEVQIEENSTVVETTDGHIIVSNFEEPTATEVASSQETEQQVLGFFEVPSKLEGNENLIQEIEFNGEQLYYQSEGGDGEPILYVITGDQDIPAAQTVRHFVQGGNVNSSLPLEVTDAKLMGDNIIVRSSTEESAIDSSALSGSEIAPEYQPIYISRENLNEMDSKNGSDILWTYTTEKDDEKEDNTGVFYISQSKLASTLMLSEEERNQKLLEFACLAQKLDRPVRVEDLQTSNSANIESVEIVSTEQQDENVSSSCNQTQSQYYPVDNMNVISEGDPSNEGLDLSVNKTVQGVSVIHVTSGSNESEVLGYIQPEIVGNEQADMETVESEQSVNIKYNLINNELIAREQQEIEDQMAVDENEFETLKQKSSVNQSISNHGVSGNYETPNVHDISNSRSSSVLVYNRKETVSETKNHGQSDVAMHESTSNDNQNSVIEFSSDLKNSSQVEYVRKSVLACNDLNTQLNYENKNIEASQLLVDEGNEKSAHDNVTKELDASVVEKPLTNSVLIMSDTMESVNDKTVIKKPQKVSSRRSKRLENLMKKDEELLEAESLPPSPNDLVVIDEVGDENLNENNQSPESDVEMKQTSIDMSISKETQNTVDANKTKDLEEKSSSDMSVSQQLSMNNGSDNPLSPLENEDKITIKTSENMDIDLPDTSYDQLTLRPDDENHIGSRSPTVDEFLENVKSPVVNPKKTYLQRQKKAKTSNVDTEVIKDTTTTSDGEIELFSVIDFDETVSNTKDTKSPNSPSVVKETSSKPFSDDDSLLFSSDIRSRGSNTYKRRKTVENSSVNKTDDNSVGNESSANTNSSERPKRLKRNKPIRYSSFGEFPNQDISGKVTTALDIENDVEEIKTSSPLKKTKPKLPMYMYKNSESSFYPSANVAFIKKAKKFRSSLPEKQNKSTKAGKLPFTSSSVILTQPNNRGLTRHQLNEKMNEYNFSVSDDYSDSDDDSRGYLRIMSHKKRRFISNKKKKNESDLKFERLLKSTPTKRRSTSSFLSRIQRKTKRRSSENEKTYTSARITATPMSIPSYSEVSFAFQSSPEESASAGRPKDDEFVKYRIQPPSPKPELPEDFPEYTCRSCEFRCSFILNYQHHLRECDLSQDFQDEIQDTERLSQIRGNSCMLFDTNFTTSNPIVDTEKRLKEEELTAAFDDDSHSDKTGKDFKFQKDDVVWVELKRTFCPALVRRVYPKKNKITVCFIDSSSHIRNKKYLTLRVDDKDDKVRSFNDDKDLFQAFLENGKKKKGESFTLSVHEAMRFYKKKKDEGRIVKAKSFFNNLQLDDFSNSESDSDDEDGTDDSILDALNLVADILACVKRGEVDDYLVGIYKNKNISDRHEKFHSDNIIAKEELAERPWFGPINDIHEQQDFYEYVFNLFKKNFGTDIRGDLLCYVYQVWCPEAVVKAISNIKSVTMDEAEKIFVSSMALTVNTGQFH